MAQVNITLNNEEVLQVLTGNRDDALKFLLERIINELMKAESEEQIGAEKHERTSERKDYRNGTRERVLNTRIGTLVLEVPRHREVPFHTMIFENYVRSEASLIATMVQMVISGVSTRKVEKVVETLCGTSFSKSTISELCKKLDAEVKEFRSRSLEYMEVPFLMVDATYFKVREAHRVKSKAFLVALAIKDDGRREIIGFDVHDAEDNYSWREFFSSLKKRGLTNVKMVTSDAHKAIRSALAEVYPDVAWQRCQVHLLRNIIDATPQKYKQGLKTELREVFNARNLKEAEARKNEIVKDYSLVAERAMEILENGYTDAMTVMELPEHVRTFLRSTNLLERLNREFKRRSDVIQVFPNTGSLMRLMGAVAMENSEVQSSKQRIYSESKCKKMLDETEEKLRSIAMQQIALLKTA